MSVSWASIGFIAFVRQIYGTPSYFLRCKFVECRPIESMKFQIFPIKSPIKRGAWEKARYSRRELRNQGLDYIFAVSRTQWHKKGERRPVQSQIFLENTPLHKIWTIFSTSNILHFWPAIRTMLSTKWTIVFHYLQDNIVDIVKWTIFLGSKQFLLQLSRVTIDPSLPSKVWWLSNSFV